MTDRIWFAGTNGETCFSLLFPSPTVDNSYAPPLNYTGSWTHRNNWPRAYDNTVSWTTGRGNFVTYNFTGSSITRLYNMATNRVKQDVYIDGVWKGTQNDNAETTRWKVAKTWKLTYGTHTIEVIKHESGGYIDLDAFIVDIPYNHAPAPGYVANRDNRNSSIGLHRRMDTCFWLV